MQIVECGIVQRLVLILSTIEEEARQAVVAAGMLEWLARGFISHHKGGDLCARVEQDATSCAGMSLDELFLDVLENALERDHNVLACMMASVLARRAVVPQSKHILAASLPLLLRALSLGRDHGGRYAAKTGSFDTLQVGMAHCLMNLTTQQ